MQYRRLGTSGLQLSALSFGAWVTFGKQVGRSAARDMLALAHERGVNYFDNAETYNNGVAEQLMGDVLADLRFPRDSYCVSSKVFFGAVDKPLPTQRGVSRKHVMEACHQALQRLRVDYLDLYFCHRADPDTPIAVVASRRSDGLDLSVVDQGPGLPPGGGAALFEPLGRAGSGRKGSAGLGLAIVKGFAEEMGLSVAARDREDPRGTIVTIGFPEAALVRRTGGAAAPGEAPESR